VGVALTWPVGVRKRRSPQPTVFDLDFFVVVFGVGCGVFFMRYRRAEVCGGTYFFTVNLADRKSQLLTDNVDLLRVCVKRVQARHPFTIDAMVVLPDHLHAMWTLPLDEHDYSMRWGLIKSGFSRQLPKTERINKSRLHKGERGIWQRRFWEHLIRDERDYENHVQYIHSNPVKHGLAERAIDWPHSTVHDYVSKGLLDHEWGGCVKQPNVNTHGEW
jgi:putative transposase